MQCFETTWADILWYSNSKGEKKKKPPQNQII